MRAGRDTEDDDHPLGRVRHVRRVLDDPTPPTPTPPATETSGWSDDEAACEI